VLSGAEVNERFPGYDIPDDHRAVYQPESGFLVPEQCIIAHVEAAQARGAEIRARETVTDVTEDASGVRVTTDRGTYRADEAVVTAGAWAREFLPSLADRLVPVRQVLAWLQPTDPPQFDPDAFPVFIHETETERFYGFPRFDVPGFKFARFNHFGEEVDPDAMSQEPRREDEEMLRAYAERHFPTGAGPTMRLSTCLFTNTPDGHFVVDAAPDRSHVTVGAGFSGHGFKFASAVGEALADLALDGESEREIGLFAADRFGNDRAG
jgi:sarcosine oxidase